MIAQPVNKVERGQALPLLALALIALAGFAALALDGGNLYSEQRRAQVAADNAVMAAAYQQMNGITGTVNLSNAAFLNAGQNGYVTGAHTTVVFHLPPVDGPYAGNVQYMEVVITQTVPTALAHLVYRQDPIPVTVIAVAHGSPTGPIMPGFALAAMKPDCPNNGSTIYMDADGGGRAGGTFLYDGGAFVNANCPNALNAAGNHDGIVTDGPPISIAGDTYDGTVCTPAEVSDPSSNCNFYPAPTTGVPQVTQDPLQGTPAATRPTCNDAVLSPVRNLATELNDPVGIHPGTYTTLDSGNRDMNLRPGIYCLTGGKMASGNGNTTGNGVLIYLTDIPASPNKVPWIDFSGSGTLDLRAPTTATTGCAGNTDPSQEICKYLGIVIYKVTGANSCDQNDDEIDFTGQASMTVMGLIYAPFSLVRYGGSNNASLTMEGQTIAGCVKFNGNGNINIIYNPSDTYSPPPSVRLDE
jgi:hypothetical protein